MEGVRDKEGGCMIFHKCRHCGRRGFKNRGNCPRCLAEV